MFEEYQIPLGRNQDKVMKVLGVAYNRTLPFGDKIELPTEQDYKYLSIKGAKRLKSHFFGLFSKKDIDTTTKDLEKYIEKCNLCPGKSGYTKNNLIKDLVLHDDQNPKLIYWDGKDSFSYIQFGVKRAALSIRDSRSEKDFSRKSNNIPYHLTLTNFVKTLKKSNKKKKPLKKKS